MQPAPQDDALLMKILAACALDATAVRFLARGATSRVWWARTPTGPVVVRLGDPHPLTGARFAADAAVRQRLHQIDGRVAEPLATGRWDAARCGAGADISWCVDRFVAGEAAPRGATPLPVCHDLGQLLSRLHAVPVAGYGLLEDRGDALVGQASDPVSGLLTRLQDPWPFTPFPLERHPLATAAPDLADRLAPLRAGLERVLLERRQPCLNHTDMHEGQLLIAGGRLAALLDFGDAAIGPPAWDIASFAYFHGWRLAQAVLTGYTRDGALRRSLHEEAWTFAVLLALHHASRSVTLRQRRRMDGAVRFLRRTLDTGVDSSSWSST